MNTYKITIKSNNRKIGAGSIVGDKLFIREGRASAKIQYIDIYLNNTVVYGYAAVGKVDVIEEDKNIFEIIYNI